MDTKWEELRDLVNRLVELRKLETEVSDRLEELGCQRLPRQPSVYVYYTLRDDEFEYFMKTKGFTQGLLSNDGVAHLEILNTLTKCINNL